MNAFDLDSDKDAYQGWTIWENVHEEIKADTIKRLYTGYLYDYVKRYVEYWS